MVKFAIIILLLFTPLWRTSAASPAPGILDLRGESCLKDRILSLRGDWMFYWDTLVPAGRFTGTNVPDGGQPGIVPSYWTGYRDREGKHLPGTGYGTYFLRILLPPGCRDSLGFILPVFDSSVGFYLNGAFAGGSGRTGTSAGASSAAYTPFTFRFRPHTDTLNLVLHVSNFRHRRGGFWKEMFFGGASPIRQQRHLKILFSDFSLGILLAFFLFFLFFYLIFPRGKLMLLFALTLAGIFIRLSFTGEYPFENIFHLSWRWVVRLEYLGTFMTFCFGSWYLHKLFPTRTTRIFNVINSYISAAITVVILLAPVRIFSWSTFYFEPLAIFLLFWYLTVSLISIRAERVNVFYSLALLLFLAAVVNDIFLSNSWSAFSTDYILHLSVLFLVFVQAGMIIRHWVEIFMEKEHLLVKIEDINANLENRVEDRTRELDVRNAEIKKQSKRISRQNDELQKEIDFKNRIFSIIAHDLRGPLSSINLYLDMASKDLPEASKKDILESTSAIARSTQILVENLLYWGRSQDKQLRIHPQDIILESVIKDIFTLSRETARQKGVDLVLVSNQQTRLTGDREIILIILRNLISNAIKFSHRGHEVTVTVEPGPEEVRITVSDKGVGMSPEQVELLHSDETMLSTYGTANEKGTGLGLRLCMELVKLHGGRMQISSRMGKGTRILVVVPVRVDVQD